MFGEAEGYIVQARMLHLHAMITSPIEPQAEDVILPEFDSEAKAALLNRVTTELPRLEGWSARRWQNLHELTFRC